MLDAGVLTASTATDILLGIGRLIAFLAIVLLLVAVVLWIGVNLKERIYDPLWEKHIHPWQLERHRRKMDKRAIEEAGRRARAEKRRELQEGDDYY